MTIGITESDDIKQTALRREFAEALVKVVNLFMIDGELEYQYVADCLFSGGAEILRKRDGGAFAAEQIRGVADIVEEQHSPH